MLVDMENAQISTNGLFLNADAGFDGEALRKTCWSKDIIANIDFNKRNTKNTDNQPLLDDLLYKERFSVERTNASFDQIASICSIPSEKPKILFTQPPGIKRLASVEI